MEGRTGIRTEMFEAQTVTASIDIENKKGNQGNSVFLRTEDRVFPRNVKSKMHLAICDIIIRTEPFFSHTHNPMIYYT